MERKLSGKVVLVTGAASGIGQAAALRVAEEGAAVTIIADLLEEAGNQTVRQIEQAGGKAHFIRVDVSQFHQMSNALFVGFVNSMGISIAHATTPESTAIGRIP
jgi:NAD(P)-dependent dehydrogenase (short-subunit alcohol dehydrogenase family)